MVKVLFSLFLIFGALFASTSTDISNYSKYKKEYFSAILNGNKNKEIQSLKKLIYYSKKLNKPVSKYQKELKILQKNVKITSIQAKPKPQKKVVKKIVNSTDSIRSVSVQDNSIVVDFKKRVSKKDLKFVEVRKNGSFRDEFIINGTLRGVNKLKLKMGIVPSVKRVAIYKSRQNSITISVRGKKNLKTIYIIGNKKITIKVLEPIKKIKSSNKATLVPQMEQKTIVIDPGHGGKDAGAVGPKRRYEKNAVLKVSNELAKLLRARGYKVYTTRSTDRYKRLKYRTSLANKKKADLFISIHANAVPKRKAHKVQGIETYYLSPARSARAKRVAALENKADLKSMGYGSKDIFLMTLNRAKINASQRLALDVQNNLLHNVRKKYRYIKDNGVRKGPFWILVGAQMPAVLVEIGYISHPTESKRLFTTSYQKLLARGIANGIDSYFIKNQH